MICPKCGHEFANPTAQAGGRAGGAALAEALREGMRLAVAAIRAMPITHEPNACALADWAGRMGKAEMVLAEAEGEA